MHGLSLWQSTTWPLAVLQVDVGMQTNAPGQLQLLLGVLMGPLELTLGEISAKLVLGAFDGATVYQGSAAGLGVLLRVGIWLCGGGIAVNS